MVEIGSMVVEKLKCAKVLSGRQTDAGQIVIKKSNDNNNFEQMYMVVKFDTVFKNQYFILDM